LTALAEAPTAFGETLEQARSFSDHAYDERASACASGNKSIFLVADHDQDGWVGMVGGRDEGRQVALVSMWVSPAHRRHGIGAALIDEFLVWASRTSALEVSLFVGDYNEAAQALYASMGFKFSGKTAPLDWDPGIQESEMVLNMREKNVTLEHSKRARK
jgi:ribosomal protein S18 acetylase RimI-like enzyme